MADIQIKNLPLRLTAQMLANDNIPIETAAGVTHRAELKDVKEYINESRVFGGSGPNDITTNNGTQTLLGKRLDNVKLNEDVVVSATATEVNRLIGLLATTNELNACRGADPAKTFQNQINDILNRIEGRDQGQTVSYSVQIGIGAGVTSFTISEEDILSSMGALGSKQRLDYIVQASFYQDDGSSTITMQNPSGITATYRTTDGKRHLKSVNFTVTPMTMYTFSVSTRVLP